MTPLMGLQQLTIVHVHSHVMVINAIWQGSAQLAEWEVRPEDLQIVTTPNGEDVVLGAGAFGAVRRQAAAMHLPTVSLPLHTLEDRAVRSSSCIMSHTPMCLCTAGSKIRIVHCCTYEIGPDACSVSRLVPGGAGVQGALERCG